MPVTDAELEELVPVVVAGNAAAWQALWAALSPRLEGLFRNPRLIGRLAQNEDDRRAIVVDVMARLREDDFHRLRLYLDARAGKPGLAFIPWLFVVAKRIAIDYLRAHPDYIDRRHSANEGSAPGAWVDPVTLPPASRIGGARPPMTTRGTAMEMLAYASAALPVAQRRALECWLQSTSFDEIAADLELGGARDAERLVRAALERLRRNFRAGPGGE